MENIEKQKVARMRTIKQCLEEIKKIDSASCVSEWFIRSLCKDNKVKHFMSGNKVLVNFDDLVRVINFEINDTKNQTEDNLNEKI